MSRIFYPIVIGWILGAGIGSVLSAQVILIPSDHPTIQSGIDAASDGDTVLIEEGTYYENINFLGKAITVASRFLVDGDTSHISKTILDGSRSTNPDTASVVSMWSGEDTTSVLCGLTITGGRGTIVDSIHGPVYPMDPKISDTLYSAGGGILIYNSGGKIIHNIIEGNHIGYDSITRGALGCGMLAAVNHHHTVIIRGNRIRRNSAGHLFAWGGGISIHGGQILVERNLIHDNSFVLRAWVIGGGIFYSYEGIEGTIPEVMIRNNVIYKNVIEGIFDISGGGALTIANTLVGGTIRVQSNLMAFNKAGIGGAIDAWNSRAEVDGNIFFGNEGSLYGDDLGTEAHNNISMLTNLFWRQNYWIASRHGVKPFGVGDAGTRWFDPAEGILIPPGETLFSLERSTGKVHIGAREGMIIFNPEKVPINGFIFKQVFIDFRSFENVPSPGSDRNGNRQGANHFRMEVPSDIYDINFSSLPFGGVKIPGVDYSYLMRERDPDTIRESGSMMASNANLKSRTYHFWASMLDTSGGNAPVEISFDLHIRTPWYRTWWIFLSYGLFLILLITIAVRIRTARLNREKIALEKEVVSRTAELRQKNEHILEMERLKTRFFTDVSHEIRTPLTLITGPLDKLVRMNHPDPKTREWLTIILRNSQRLLQLVNQLLDISRLESGQMKLVLEHSDLTKHIKVLVSQYSSLADSRHIRFVTDIPEEELVTWYDREKLTKITYNLLSNAFKFTPVNGVVTCRVRIPSKRNGANPVQQHLRMIVADTGAGIPMEEREKIFTRFYRSHHAGLEDAGGTGIGLALTRELVQLMHGEVALKSLEGKGSVFIVTFPLGKDHLKEEEYVLKEADPSGTPELEIPLAAAEKELKSIPEEKQQEILVVEDNTDLRSFIKENLSREFRVIAASDGEEGLGLAFARLPDLVITDVMMPGVDGMELCATLKGDKRTSHIPVIILTAKATRSDRREGLELGADDYLLKPFEMEELLIRIRNLLEQRKKLREKYSAMIGMDWETLNVTTLDERFLKKLTRYITDHIDDFDLNVEKLKEEVAMSREHLFRKLKALTGDSPTGLIQTMRMKAAAEMLQKSNESITRIALNAGYSSPSYFAKSFRKHFGISPNEYRKSKGNQGS